MPMVDLKYSAAGGGQFEICFEPVGTTFSLSAGQSIFLRASREAAAEIEIVVWPNLGDDRFATAVAFVEGYNQALNGVPLAEFQEYGQGSSRSRIALASGQCYRRLAGTGYPGK